MNVVNVRVDRVSYRLAEPDDAGEVRASITDAVRSGGGFVRLETDYGTTVFVMCSPGVSIVVATHDESDTSLPDPDSPPGFVSLLSDPLFDHLL